MCANKQSTVLLPKARHKRSHRNKGWKLYVNAKVEYGRASEHSLEARARFTFL